jgi:hypothetical protein
MPLQKRIAGTGISKQTAKGAPAASATYGLGIRGGSPLMLDLQQENDEITFSSRVSAYDNRLSITPGASIQTRLWAASGGLLLYGALGAISDSGVGPYTHTITPGATLPYLTHFAQFDTEYHKIADCKVNQLELAWTERSPIEVTYELMGITWTGYTGSYTVTNDESGNARFIPPGGTFQVDTNSGTPATAKIAGGRITINNNLVPIPLSASTLPDDVFEAEAALEVELRLIPTDTTEWRKIVTGTNVGTAAAGTEIYGSFSEKFTIDANTELTLASTRVAFLADYPEADPSGGPAELTVVGRIKKPAATPAFTATLKNAVASY